jgi:SAM-dependent methyltransferase
MRELVGRPEREAFENPDGALVHPELPESVFRRVFDFGCGCGRIARQLMEQRPRPERYLGIDVHHGMIEWCRQNLAPAAPEFEFVHHDVFSRGLNPTGAHQYAPFPAGKAEFTLVEAWSIFTHLTEPQAEFYLREVARVLEPGGVMHSTWFLFDKQEFPMMQDFQNALYINEVDPSNSVIFDREWLGLAMRAAGLTVTSVTPPEIRGFQWVLVLTPTRQGVVEADFPPDEAPLGRQPPPLLREAAHLIGVRSK